MINHVKTTFIFSIVFFASLIMCWGRHHYNHRFTIYKNGTENPLTYVLLQHRHGILRSIPDDATVESFGIDPRNDTLVPPLPIDFLKKYRIGEPIPSLKMSAQRTPDERMRNMVQNILAIDSALFIKDMYKIPPPHLNPSFAIWPRGSNKYLFTWRKELSGPPVFGWMGSEFHQILTSSSASLTSHNSTTTTTTSLASNQSMESPYYVSVPAALAYRQQNIYLDNATDHLGLGPNNSSDILHTKDHMNEIPYDIRFLPMPDNSLILAFSIKKGGGGLWTQGYSRITVSDRDGRIQGLDSTTLLQAPSGEENHDQKNWVPFEHDGRLLFMQKMDPLTIVEAMVPLSGNQSSSSSSSSSTTDAKTPSGGLSDHGKVIHVSQPISDEARPWKGHYGMPLRGGTPAIKVRGVYLTFFHTLLMFQLPYKIRTYFMGAMTFCAHPPFQPLAMSAVPIVHPSWYDGPWISIKLDYCVFPISASVELKENGEEGDHVWVTIGRQDSEGVLLKMNINELFHSLDKIDGADECKKN